MNLIEKKIQIKGNDSMKKSEGGVSRSKGGHGNDLKSRIRALDVNELFLSTHKNNKKGTGGEFVGAGVSCQKKLKDNSITLGGGKRDR